MPRISTGVDGGASSSGIAAIVEHGAHFAVDVADYEIVAVTQRAILYEHGCDRTTAAIQFGFEHHTLRRTLRRSFQFLQIGNQDNHFH